MFLLVTALMTMEWNRRLYEFSFAIFFPCKTPWSYSFDLNFSLLGIDFCGALPVLGPVLSLYQHLTWNDNSAGWATSLTTFRGSSALFLSWVFMNFVCPHYKLVVSLLQGEKFICNSNIFSKRSLPVLEWNTWQIIWFDTKGQTKGSFNSGMVMEIQKVVVCYSEWYFNSHIG